MTKTERIQFRISKEKKDFIQTKCKEQNITISEFMINTLNNYCKFQEGK